MVPKPRYFRWTCFPKRTYLLSELTSSALGLVLLKRIDARIGGGDMQTRTFLTFFRLKEGENFCPSIGFDVSSGRLLGTMAR